MPRHFSKLPVTFCCLMVLALLAAGCESKQQPQPADTATPAPPEDAGATGSDGTSSSAGAAGDVPPEAMTDAARGNGSTPMPSGGADGDPAGIGQTEPADVPPGTDPLVPAGVTRPTTEGWWRIIFSVNGNEHSAGFLEIAKDDAGKLAVGEVRTNSVINPAKIVRSDVTDTTVALFFDDGSGNQFDYAGTLAGNVIRGNLQFDSPRQNLVRLVPVAEADITDEEVENQQLGTTFGLEAISAAIQSDEPAAGLNEVAKVWPTSPVLYMAYDMLISQAKPLELDRETVAELATGFEKTGAVWGERARQAAKINTAASLLYTVHEVDFATAKLNEVRQEAPELVAKWDELLKPAERVVAIEEARKQIDDGNAEQGLTALRTLHADRPVDPVGAYRLAVAEQKHGSKDNALKLFAQLAVQPQSDAELSPIADEVDFTPPRTAAARLFEEQHGNRDGLPEFLNETYHETVTSFLTDEQKSRLPSASERTTLVELFTGAMCPPCVAADVATEAVEKSFPGSDVVVLRYHLHIPGPDPLSNRDAEDRRDFYGDKVRGTPTIFIDGGVAPHNVGGRYSNAPDVYEALAGTVAAAAEKPAGATIDLSASVENNVLKIAASATGIENPADSLRLRIVLTENQIDFAANNGIRGHEMVVREMPGGAAGVAAVDGQFSYQQDVPLVETRERLATYLRDFEKQLSGQGGQRFSFPQKPLDLRRLSVVAFLQDDSTHEILQTAVLPIEQEIELPALAEASDAAPGEPAAPDDDGAETDDTETNGPADEAGGPSITPPE